MAGKSQFATPGQSNMDDLAHITADIQKRNELYGALWERERRKSSFGAIDWFKKGRNLHAMGKYEEAVQAFDNLIQFHPNNPLERTQTK
jgi:hypothetical protein